MSTPMIDVRSPDDPSSRAPRRHVPRADDQEGGHSPRIDVGIISLEGTGAWGWAWYQHPESWGVGIMEESDEYSVEIESLFHTVYSLPNNRDIALHLDSPSLYDAKMNLRSMLMAESMGRVNKRYDMDMIREINLLLISRDGKESTILHDSDSRNRLLLRAEGKLVEALNQHSSDGTYDPGPGWHEEPARPEGPERFPYRGQPIRSKKGQRRARRNP